MKSIIIKLITSTAEMRRLQKEYFRTRSKFVLRKALSQEKLVDNLLEEVISEEIIPAKEITITECIQEIIKFSEQ